MSNEFDNQEWLEEFLPVEDDIYTSDYRDVFQHGRRVLVTSPSHFNEDVKAYMDAQQYWPNVWIQLERGDVILHDWDEEMDNKTYEVTITLEITAKSEDEARDAFLHDIQQLATFDRDALLQDIETVEVE